MTSAHQFAEDTLLLLLLLLLLFLLLLLLLLLLFLFEKATGKLDLIVEFVTPQFKKTPRMSLLPIRLLQRRNTF